MPVEKGALNAGGERTGVSGVLESPQIDKKSLSDPLVHEEPAPLPEKPGSIFTAATETTAVASPSSEVPPISEPQAPKPFGNPYVFFCFGESPGQYLFHSSEDLLYNMPLSISNVLEEGPIEKIFSASVAEGDQAWMHYECKDGRKCQYRSSALIKKKPKLEKWIQQTIKNNSGPLCVSLAGSRSYVAVSLTQHKSVSDNVHRNLTKVLNTMDTYSSISLGYGQDFLTRGTENKSSSTWWTAFPTLCWIKCLKEKSQKSSVVVRNSDAPSLRNTSEIRLPLVFKHRPNSDQFATLSQHNMAEFFLVFSDKEVHFYVDDSFRKRLGDAITRAGFTSHPYEKINSSSPAAADPNRPVTAAELTAELNKRDSAKKSKGTGTALVTGLAAGVLVASCSVM